jgi:hypothetical protein
MTKTLIIKFDEKDENFLLTFFKKMRVEAQQIPEIDEKDKEVFWVKQRLNEKYVKSGKWDTMSDDVRQDAVLVEMMSYSTLVDNSKMSDTEASVFLAQLKNGTYSSQHQ